MLMELNSRGHKLMKSTLDAVQDWYASQCNGEWEHQYGVKIDTLDNPGWQVTIDLNLTKWEHLSFEERKIDNGADDWILCRKAGPQFFAAGDTRKLEVILSHFLRFVGES